MATSNMQQPILATVVALELERARSEIVPGAHLEEFARLLVTTVAQSCSVQRQLRGEAADGLTIVMPPEVAVGSVLRRTAGAARLFERKHAGERVRLLAHHGVVFSAREGKRDAYIGSAVRSAHATLRRLEAATHCVATREFVKFADGWSASPLAFAPLSGAAALEDLSALSIDEEVVAEPGAARVLSPQDPALLRFLSHRLAEDVGPFASVLVEAARRSAVNVDSLIAELSHEIERPEARTRFVDAAQRYVDEQGGAA